jgi:hypothetical protein
VGFWTPEYLARKRETLRRFRGHNALLAVPVAAAVLHDAGPLMENAFGPIVVLMRTGSFDEASFACRAVGRTTYLAIGFNRTSVTDCQTASKTLPSPHLKGSMSPAGGRG